LSTGGSPPTTELPSLESATAGYAAHLTATAEMPASEAATDMAAAAEATATTVAATSSSAPARQSASRDGGSSECDGSDQEDGFVKLDILHDDFLSFT
jgi:type IV secretory pathway TrbL component